MQTKLTRRSLLAAGASMLALGALPHAQAQAKTKLRFSSAFTEQDLRADAVRVVASRQVSQGGGWTDAPVQAATVQRLEDIILTKARDLRRASITK